MGSTYVRNDSANNIADGNVISAADLDGEFDKLVTAFTAGTGHTHDGTAGEGGYVTELLGTAIKIGDGTAGTDIAVTFDGESNDGVLTWMEDEDRFDFADKVKIVDGTDIDVADTSVGSLIVSGGAVIAKDLLAGNDILLDSDSSIVKFGADQDITLTHAADTSLALGGAGGTTGLIINNTAGDGDPFLAFALSGTQVFTMGVDDGDSDKFKIGTTAIGTSTILTLTGDDVILADDLSLQSDGALLNFGEHDDITLTHAADTSLALGGAGGTTGLIINNTAGDGDPFLAFALSGTQTFTMGIDDGDSDKFKIGTSAIGTNTRLTIDSSGNSEFSGSVTAGGDVTAKTGDGAILALQTSLDTVIDGSVLGTIQFTAPEEASDTDSRELAAEIAAVAEEAFSTTSNATELVFKTGASEAATSKMVLTSGGNLTLPTDSVVLSFGADSDTTLTHTDGTGLTLNSTNKLTFGDVATFIHQSTDGQLDVDADTELELTAPTVDIAASTAVTIATPSLIISDNTTSEPIVQIKNTHNGTTAGELRFVMDKGSAGADGDDLGTISFYGDDAGQNQTAFAKIVGEVSEADETDEAGKLSFYVAESDGTDTALTAGLILEGEHATDGEVDVTIGAGAASTTTVAGNLAVTTSIEGGIVFNDSSADVDFRIESGGNANMFMVDGDTNAVGIGTAPTSSGNIVVHIQQGDSGCAAGDAYHAYNNLIVETNAGEDGGGIGLHGDNTSLLQISFGDPEDSNAGVIYYHHEVNLMQFKTAGTDRFSIDSDGRHVMVCAANGNTALHITNNQSTPYGIALDFSTAAPDDNTSYFLHGEDSSANRFRVFSDGDLVNADNSYGAISDERIKQDIVDANSQWDDIKAVKVRNFKKKDDVLQYGDKAWSQIGVVAQELETVSPKLVKESPPEANDIRHSAEFGTLYEDGDTIPEGKEIGDVKEVKDNVKKVSYSILYMKAVKALQEAMARIETLETKVKALEDA